MADPASPAPTPETPQPLSARWQELFWALPPGEMRSKLRALEIDTGRLIRQFGSSFDFENLRDVLCNVSQIFGGWRGEEVWTTYDEEIAKRVVAIQLEIDAPTADRASILDELHRLLTAHGIASYQEPRLVSDLIGMMARECRRQIASTKAHPETPDLPDGELFDQLQAVADWFDQHALVTHSTPWLVKRDIVLAALNKLRRPATPDLQTVIEDAERLLAHITPGEWEVSPRESQEWNSPSSPRSEIVAVKGRDSEFGEVQYRLAQVSYPPNPQGTAGAIERASNAQFIAAAPRLVRQLADALQGRL